MNSVCFKLLYFFGVISTGRSQIFQQENYNYCDPKLKLCEVYTDHTMCKYPLAGLSTLCTPGLKEPLSATEKKRILFWHNKFRSNIANGSEKNRSKRLPTSSNMRQIYWDKELEAIATRWAEQCTSTTSAFPYDVCRNTSEWQPPRTESEVSQNVGTRRTNDTNIDKQAPQMVISWYKESKDFDPSLIDKYVLVQKDNFAVKHFSNIIWAETYAIGCARVIFQEQLPSANKTSKDTWTTERLVCNYGPGGNQIGKPVYKRGASCESCPSGTQCSLVFPGLCAIQNVEKMEGQQNMESQEPKDDDALSKTVTSKASQGTEEPILEDEQDEGLLSSIIPEMKLSEVEEEGCEGEKCSMGGRTSTPSNSVKRLEDKMKPPSPSGAKYLVRKGVYLNGKCHCSEVQRSSGRPRHSPTHSILLSGLLAWCRLTFCRIFSA